MAETLIVKTMHLVNYHPLELAAHPEVRAVLDNIWFGAERFGEKLGASLREFFERGNHAS